MNEFWQMGGYGFYVWSSYGLTLLVLILNLVIPVYKERALLRTLAHKERRKIHDRDDF